MSDDGQSISSADGRVLVLAPTGRDAPLVSGVLRAAGMDCISISDMDHLCHEIKSGAGVVVVAEEALSDGALDRLGELIAQQPPWSDLPIILLTGRTEPAPSRMASFVSNRGNLTLLERPVRTLTLTSAVRVALRARKRQLEVRDLLAEKDRAVRQRDHFLAMLGHELRNPLATIRTAVELVRARNGRNGDAEQTDIIARQADHLARLVDDLLDVSRVTSGKIILRRVPSDIVEITRRSLETAQATCDTQEQSLTFNSEQARFVIEGDPVRLEQVVTNLLTNACKYTPRGGRIDVSITRDGGWAVLRVRDTGIGISPELLPRLFEPFSQGDTSLHRAQGGLGIGLSIVKRLVEMQGGRVDVHSDGIDRGSTFEVRYPLRPDLTIERAPIEIAGSASRNVLIVEDNADARRVMSSLLKLWGHRVSVASDGPDGVAAAQANNPEIILMDIGLPGMDGYEAARAVRQRLGNRTFMVALTGYGQPEDRTRALDAGFDLHLVKPVPPELLSYLLMTAKPGQPFEMPTGTLS